MTQRINGYAKSLSAPYCQPEVAPFITKILLRSLYHLECTIRTTSISPTRQMRSLQTWMQTEPSFVGNAVAFITHGVTAEES